MEHEEQPSDLNLVHELAALRSRVEALEKEVSQLRADGLPASRPLGRAQPTPQYTITPPPPPPQKPGLLGRLPLPPSARSGTEKPANTQSFESRLGSQIFNRIGVLAILIGAAAFLKLAIDNQWIGPVGRVLSGLLAGAGVVLWSEIFRRKSYLLFSYSLKAVGTGILYLSLWAAFQLYHLLPSPVAFGAMLLVTAWNAWMAWSQDSELLAVYALAGAFSTPALLSTGENHPVFLFSYLLILCIAVVSLVAAKPWHRLLAGAIPATVAYYIGWYSHFYTEDQYLLTSFFTVMIFLLFAGIPLIRSSQESVLLTVYAPLAAGLFGPLAFYSLLQDSHRHSWLPWGAIAFSAFYLGLLRLQSRLRPNPASAAVHLALAVVLLTVAIPLKASGRWITVGWLTEGAALLWVATSRVQSAPSKIRRTLGVLAVGSLALGYLGLLTLPLWTSSSVSPIFNARFATECFGMAVVAVSIWLSLRAGVKEPIYASIAGLLSIGLNTLILVAAYREIFHFWTVSTTEADNRIFAEFTFSAFIMLHGAALLAVGFWKRVAFVRWQGLALLVGAIGKVFVYDMRSLSQGYRVLSFIGLGALLMAVSFAYQKDWLGLRAAAVPAPEKSE